MLLDTDNGTTLLLMGKIGCPGFIRIIIHPENDY